MLYILDVSLKNSYCYKCWNNNMASLVQMVRKDIYSSACLTMEWKWVPYLPQLKCDKQDVLNFSDISSADKIVKKKSINTIVTREFFVGT